MKFVCLFLPALPGLGADFSGTVVGIMCRGSLDGDVLTVQAIELQ